MDWFGNIFSRLSVINSWGSTHLLVQRPYRNLKIQNMDYQLKPLAFSPHNKLCLATIREPGLCCISWYFGNLRSFFNPKTLFLKGIFQPNLGHFIPFYPYFSGTLSFLQPWSKVGNTPSNTSKRILFESLDIRENSRRVRFHWLSYTYRGFWLEIYLKFGYLLFLFYLSTFLIDGTRAHDVGWFL